MSNTISFDKAKIWRNDIKTDNGEFSAYTVTVSSKNQSGDWDRAYLPIRFAKSSGAPEKISNGTVADIEGFLSARVRKDGRNEVQMIVMSFKAEEELPAYDDIPDNFEQAAVDIPF